MKSGILSVIVCLAFCSAQAVAQIPACGVDAKENEKTLSKLTKDANKYYKKEVSAEKKLDSSEDKMFSVEQKCKSGKLKYEQKIKDAKKQKEVYLDFSVAKCVKEIIGDIVDDFLCGIVSNANCSDKDDAYQKCNKEANKALAKAQKYESLEAKYETYLKKEAGKCQANKNKQQKKIDAAQVKLDDAIVLYLTSKDTAEGFAAQCGLSVVPPLPEL